MAEKLAAKLPNEPIGLYAGADRSRMLRGDTQVHVERDLIKKAVKEREIRLVVATDAACEGLNLQTLGTLINVDLPWNPSRLEQRIGRIKRFGQARDSVDMLHLVYHGTRDERVYERLSERMRDRYDIFGSLPDVIEDDWIENIDELDERISEFIEKKKRANAFDIRYSDTVDPTGEPWEKCAQVLSRKDVVERLSRGLVTEGLLGERGARLRSNPRAEAVMSENSKTLRQAAVDLLRELGPTHYQELTDQILSRGMASSSSKTPAASLNAMIAVDIKRNGNKSEFVRVRPGVFGLRALHAAGAKAEPPTPDAAPSEGEDGIPAKDETEQRVRTPLFPTYREVRHLLKVWPGRPRKQITGLQATLGELRGTPQNTVDWTDPDAWMPERLSGDDQELASAIWTHSGKAVNPRHTYGHWLPSQKYELVEDGPDGNLALTDRGRDFIENEGGEAEVFLDEQEGLAKLLALVADNGPTRAGGILEEWTEYLNRVSSFGSPSTFRDTLRRRLNNLLDRGLVDRKSTMYSVTDAGLAYLQRVGTEEALGGDELQDLWKLAKKQEASVRESLLELLLDMDPFAFEHLIKRLLEEMDYQNVEVTSRSGDGGVDVVADIELGITSVREVVQVKKHRRPIQRKDLDARRGSLCRFDAVRGTIVTTARFAKGTQEAAFATGAAPITLIDGAKLIDMLIEHGIGVRKLTIEMLEVDPSDFQSSDLEGS